MCITAGMKSRLRVGEKGQVVIPKELRELTGIKEGTEVTVGLKDGAVTIRRLSVTSVYLDSNIFISPLVYEGSRKAANAKRILGMVERGEVVGYTSTLT